MGKKEKHGFSVVDVFSHGQTALKEARDQSSSSYRGPSHPWSSTEQLFQTGQLQIQKWLLCCSMLPKAVQNFPHPLCGSGNQQLHMNKYNTLLWYKYCGITISIYCSVPCSVPCSVFADMTVVFTLVFLFYYFLYGNGVFVLEETDLTNTKTANCP